LGSELNLGHHGSGKYLYRNSDSKAGYSTCHNKRGIIITLKCVIQHKWAVKEDCHAKGEIQ
jgi:hypothetical protein